MGLAGVTWRKRAGAQEPESVSVRPGTWTSQLLDRAWASLGASGPNTGGTTEELSVLAEGTWRSCWCIGTGLGIPLGLGQGAFGSYVGTR